MRILSLLLLPILLFAFEVFPSNSADFTAWAIGFGGSEAGYEIVGLFTDNHFVKLFSGIIGGVGAHIVFYNHFSTNEEHKWIGKGRLEWIPFRITFDLIKLWRKK